MQPDAAPEHQPLPIRFQPAQASSLVRSGRGWVSQEGSRPPSHSWVSQASLEGVWEEVSPPDREPS